MNEAGEWSEEQGRWHRITEALALRSGSHCEGCGRPFAPGRVEPSRHHRKGGQMGGRKNNPDHDSVANLMLLCGGRLAGVLGCHGWVTHNPAAGYALGWLVHDWEDPAEIPVMLPSGRWVLLDPWYGYRSPPGGEWTAETTRAQRAVRRA